MTQMMKRMCLMKNYAWLKINRDENNPKEFLAANVVTRDLKNFGKKVWQQKGWLKSYFLQRITGKIDYHILDKIETPIDLIISIANHFEPNPTAVGLKTAIASVEEWCQELEDFAVRDFDGHPFKHSYYFPAEQYNPELLFPLEAHCSKGFGEVEIHLHHGIEIPDNSNRLRERLEKFREKLRSHGFLSYDIKDLNKRPRYCFVHGNWALVNSSGGRFFGVDNEVEILAETGCYMDCTYPCAPNIAQINKINSIYECGYPLSQSKPHRDGRDLIVGDKEPTFPFLLQGPLLLQWKFTSKRMYLPYIENGALNDYRIPSIDRFKLWMSANIHVKGRPNWIFIKLHTHSLQNDHRNSVRGPVMRRFLEGLSSFFNDGIRFRLHFTTSRESANMILAAIDGKTGNPDNFRNYRFRLFYPPRFS